MRGYVLWKYVIMNSSNYTNYPSLIRRIWICISDYKFWRFRKKIDKAACAMWNKTQNDLAAEMLNYSDKLWEEAFKLTKKIKS